MIPLDFSRKHANNAYQAKVCGAAGAACNMFISPTPAVMVLHNVETTEKI